MKRLEFDYLLLDKIDISISNVRKTNLKEGIDELANSIKEIGVQQPIVVFTKGDRYELIIGQRRYLACKKIGKKEIPALIAVIKNKTEATIVSFSENIHRLDLEYRDKMQVAIELLSKLGSINKVAEHLGVSPQTVKNYIGYAAVPEPIKDMVSKGKLSVSTATRIIKNIPNEKQALDIAEKIKEIPRNEDRRKIIDIAKENPNKTPGEIVKIAKSQNFGKVTIDLTPRVANALSQACHKYESDPEDITSEALEEWLNKRGFL
jgi:ParB family chromosome partitioning protein